MKKTLSVLFVLCFAQFSFSQLTGVVDFSVNPMCFGLPLGEAQVSASGGTPPYTFVINPPGGFQSSVDADTEHFLGLMAGNYIVTITDATMATFNVNFSLIDPPPLMMAVSETPDTCGQCVGTAVLTATGGTLPYLYSPDNGLTYGTPSFFNNLCAATYDFMVQDANGCTAQQQTAIVNNLTGGGSAVGLIATSPSYCNDGSLVLTITSGDAPFEVNWNTGDTMFLVNNAGPGAYIATVTDANGCQNQIQGTVADSSSAGGCSTISGNIYADANNNCMNNAEVGLNYMSVKANPGNFVTTTDGNGDYTLNIPYGTYDVSQYLPLNMVNNCTTTYNVTTNAGNTTSTGNDFADSVNIDYGTDLFMGLIRPIMPTGQVLYSHNNSSLSGDATIYYVPDPSFTVSNTTPSFDTQNGDTLFWNNVTIAAYSSNAIQIEGNTTSPIGTTLHFCHGVWPTVTDSYWMNNEMCDSINVIASYDPNDKQVFPSGDIELTDETLKYQIRFQNTGTDTAFNIFIMDTLSMYLDPSTFEFVASSHYCVPEIINNNILKFTFPNIMLPDSNVNEPLSHGHVIFRINQSASNQVGDVIENTVGIYFDYNEPVITNTTSSEIVQLMASVSNYKISEFNVYPNPAKNEFTIQGDFQLIKNIAIYDAQGRVVYAKANNGDKNITINSSDWDAGIYMIQIVSGDEVSTGKVVIE